MQCLHQIQTVKFVNQDRQCEILPRVLQDFDQSFQNEPNQTQRIKEKSNFNSIGSIGSVGSILFFDI